VGRTSQLRVYTIRTGALDRFVEAWRSGVAPLRRRFGFDIEFACVDRERNRFLWVVSYDGPEGFEARDAAYYASSERAALDPDPAAFIVGSEHLLVDPVSVD
jgi:hypothetical protein